MNTPYLNAWVKIRSIEWLLICTVMIYWFQGAIRAFWFLHTGHWGLGKIF